MEKTRKYYTLLVKEDGPNKWMIYFGDYDRKTVVFEQDCITQFEYLKKNTKIVETGDKQEDINRAVDQMNAMPNKW